MEIRAFNKTIHKIYLILALWIIALFPLTADGAHYAGPLTGYILLQVESRGEAWYVYPSDGKAYYLGRPTDAFNIMKRLALGAKHDFIAKTNLFPKRLAGIILLDAEKNGEAYYIYPKNLTKYYLGRPADGFNIMRQLGQGISDADLANLTNAATGEPAVAVKPDQKSFISNVPFAAQAPFGNWSDPRQQNGCEEISALMAVKWARSQSLTKEEARREVTGISDWLQKKYGEYRDVSAQDTVDWIFKDYFKYDKTYLMKDVSVNDIIAELARGNLVVTPVNGQILPNPNYTQPGPPQHMIVIRGYDPATRQFITNDPGTRQGELYKYDAKVLFDAIRDYPTGYHETIKQIEKNMIVASK